MGTILEIDLTTKKIEKTPLNMNLVEQFLGGAGYACAYLFQHLTKETDPLGPDNKLFFMTGPLTGTSATSTGRMVVCAKSPLTNIWGEANSGSHICVQIKKAGYDGIIIHGASKSPVYLEINDDEVEIKDASNLWGKGLYEITDILKSNEKFKYGRVLGIGKAGENLVKYSIIGSEERAFGRTGLGAVMGSKKLKAIVVKGSKKIELADPTAFNELAKINSALIMEGTQSDIFQQLGTSNAIEMYSLSGELPVGYYRKPEFEGFEEIAGSTLAEKYLKTNRHCFSCPIGCGRVVEIGENDLGLPSGSFEGPEYETIAGFGSMILNADLKEIIKANYICNDLGLDTISTSSVIALLMDLKERGVITATDVDGIDMGWGNMESTFKMIEKIANRDGIGNILAEGSLAVGNKFNVNPEQIATICNSEPTYHDMRNVNGMAIAYGISPHYGGSHNACDMYMNVLGVCFDELGIESAEEKENSPTVSKIAAQTMDHRAFYSAAIICVFADSPVKNLAKFLEYATGMPFNIEKIKIMGQRILTMKRLFNLKMGHKPEDEHIPKILLTPLPESGHEGNVPDYEFLKSEFYKYEEWEKETGMPSREKLERLGLIEYAKF